jgi:hypothetical protein
MNYQGTSIIAVDIILSTRCVEDTASSSFRIQLWGIFERSNETIFLMSWDLKFSKWLWRDAMLTAWRYKLKEKTRKENMNFCHKFTNQIKFIYVPVSTSPNFSFLRNTGSFHGEQMRSNFLRKTACRSLLWSSGQSSWLHTQRSRVQFPTLLDILSSSGSGTGSTQLLDDVPETGSVSVRRWRERNTHYVGSLRKSQHQSLANPRHITKVI